MQKINIEKNNESYDFVTSLSVRIADLAGGLHVGNQTLISYLTEAQMQLMKTLGFPKLMVGSAMPINAHLEISYLAEAEYGDELEIGLSVEEFMADGYILQFNMLNIEKQRVICQSRWLMKFLDIQQHKPCNVPKEFIKAYKALGR